MIPKPYRLNLSHSPFKGVKQTTADYVLITQPSIHPKFAIRVSKKISPRAVVRNRLKRQLMFWLYEHRTKILPQSILVILKRPPQNLVDLFQNLEKML